MGWPDVQEAVAAEWARYEERMPGSAAAFAAARGPMPGGDSRSTLFHPPHPLFLDRGAGSRVWDVDGNELVDLTNNHTALVHGNAHPVVLDAVRRQLERGTCFSGPTPLQIEVADLLTARVPSLDQVRFCASGTEAVLHATRAARAFTGRLRIAKAEGAYHGSHDDVFVSTHTGPDDAGPADRPHPVARAGGLGRSALVDTLVFPFNDVDATVAVLREAGPELAAVLVEPVMGSAGMIPADPGWIAAVREVTTEVGALLVVDEVITFRLTVSGGQGWFGIAPDLSCFGKMLGGGFPLGAFGGRADVMAAFDPTGEGPEVAHPGSMNAWSVGLAACQATLGHLDADRIADLNARGDDLRARLQAVADRRGAPLRMTGAGSLLGLHLTDRRVRTYRDTWAEDRELAHGVFLGLVSEGVLTDPRGAACLSTVTTEDDLDRAEGALARLLERLSG
jgi:glutamate-1-semialdehyde 2,1-aminomutase